MAYISYVLANDNELGIPVPFIVRFDVAPRSDTIMPMIRIGHTCSLKFNTRATSTRVTNCHHTRATSKRIVYDDTPSVTNGLVPTICRKAVARGGMSFREGKAYKVLPNRVECDAF